jgi:hypothetical protein
MFGAAQVEIVIRQGIIGNFLKHAIYDRHEQAEKSGFRDHLKITTPPLS